jgi:hypothetical protein
MRHGRFGLHPGKVPQVSRRGDARRLGRPSRPRPCRYGTRVSENSCTGREGTMSSLATEDILLRSGLMWAFGFVSSLAINGYTAHIARSRRVSAWLIILLLVAQCCLAVGSAGLGAVVGRAASGPGGPYITLVLNIVCIVGACWLSMIAVQFAANLVCRLIGAPTQRIRWISDAAKPRSRRAARRRETV